MRVSLLCKKVCSLRYSDANSITNGFANRFKIAVFPVNDFDSNWATPIIPPTQQHGSFGNNSYSNDWPPTNADGFENSENYPEDFGAIDNGIYWIWEAS